MKGKLLWLLAVLLVASAHIAEAQQPGKVYRIGYITNAPGIRENIEKVFQQALTDLGYRNGENSVIEWRFSKGRVDHLPDLANDLVRLNVDCIVALGVAPNRAAKQATLTIPIIMANAAAINSHRERIVKRYKKLFGFRSVSFPTLSRPTLDGYHIITDVSPA
jgi:ABC-type uncharacterized transport system substrate-binding protein